MIVCCAQSARDVHVARGYARTKMVVIPNGYDLKELKRNPELRGQTRVAFGFGDEDLIVGIVGRFDPQKDHETFVLSAAALAAKVDRVKFLMVGRGINSANEVLKGWIAQSGWENRFVLAGERSDIPRLLAGLDVLMSFVVMRRRFSERCLRGDGGGFLASLLMLETPPISSLIQASWFPP